VSQKQEKLKKTESIVEILQTKFMEFQEESATMLSEQVQNIDSQKIEMEKMKRKSEQELKNVELRCEAEKI
jgi:hypothetical protein